VPLVHGGLDAVTLGEQGDVFRGQIGHDVVEAFPELVFVHASGGQHLVVDEVQQRVSHLQVVNRGACSHENLWGQVKKMGCGLCSMQSRCVVGHEIKHSILNLDVNKPARSS
jgi:hypothetical protein